MRQGVTFAIGGALAAGATFGIWDYTAPDRVAVALQSAVLQNDANTVNSYIDFPTLRANLTAQFAARLYSNSTVIDRMSPERAASRKQSVEAMVDGLVSPQTIQLAIDTVSKASGKDIAEGAKPLLAIKRDGFNRFHLPLEASDRLAVRFERRGLGWRVTDLKLPYDLKAAFAAPAPLYRDAANAGVNELTECPLSTRCGHKTPDY